MLDEAMRALKARSSRNNFTGALRAHLDIQDRADSKAVVALGSQ